MSDPFIGTINTFGFNFAPRNWSNCSGQLLSISQLTAVFSLLGTTYGGDGRTTFALPDIRGRTPVNVGRHPGSSFTYYQGQMMGYEYVNVTTSNLPSHTHGAGITSTGGSLTVSKDSADKQTVEDGDYIASQPALGSYPQIYNGSTPAAGNTAQVGSLEIEASITIGNTGGSQPLANIQPVIALNFCIALEGLYPSRN